MAWITALAILASAGIGWLGGRRNSARQTTIDFIATHEVGNREWRQNTLWLRQFTATATPEALEALATPQENEDFENQRVLASVLSHLEMVAVAIDQKVIVESIYKKWNRTNYVRIWLKVAPYVIRLRKAKNQESAFENFQRLAEKWKETHDS